jgi:NADH-quinone oxidoreductase subunit M
LGGGLLGMLRDRERARKLCIIICLLTLACATGEWIDFSMLDTFEARDHGDVFVAMLHQDVLVVDGLSAPLLPLAALLYLMTVLSTLKTKVNRFSFGWTLFSEAILLATFSSREGWMLIALLALGTLPPWIELRYRRREVTRIYAIHMGLFVALLVMGWLLLPADANRDPNHAGTRAILAGALLTAAALIRAGIVPLHCWMTDLFERATFGTALLFVVPMPGAYAVMRLVMPIAPSWALQSIAILSLLTSVYAACMALVETDSRRFFCYLLLSHSSLVLVGFELVTPIGLTGALCVWLSVGLSLGGFGLTMRSVEARMGRISLSEFHGLYEHTPMLAGLFLLTGLASIGFPGTAGFIGTELLIEGAVGVYPLVGMAVVVAGALNGIAILQAYFRIFTGTRFTASISFRSKLPERIAVLVLTALILGGGLYPQPGVSSRYHAAMKLMEQRASRRPSAEEKPDETELAQQIVTHAGGGVAPRKKPKSQGGEPKSNFLRSTTIPVQPSTKAASLGN